VLLAEQVEQRRISEEGICNLVETVKDFGNK
jgi:hypothetical protein